MIKVENYLLFNCSDTSIVNWHANSRNNRTALIYTTSQSGNKTLHYQKIESNCAPQVLRTKLQIFPFVNFLTDDLVLITWTEKETISDNSLGYGDFRYINGTSTNQEFSLGDPSLNHKWLHSSTGEEGAIDLAWIESSTTNDSLVSYNVVSPNFDYNKKATILNQSASTIQYPSILSAQNNTIISWQERPSSSSSDWDVFKKFYSGSFNNSQNITRVNNYTNGIQGRPNIASTNDTYIIVYRSIGQVHAEDVFFEIVDMKTDKTVIAESIANTHTTGGQYLPNVAGTQGVYSILWSDDNQGGIHARFLYSNGTFIGDSIELSLESGSKKPNLWVEDSKFFYGWLAPHLGRDVLYGATVDVRQFLPNVTTATRSRTQNTPSTNSLSETYSPSIPESLSRSTSTTPQETTTPAHNDSHTPSPTSSPSITTRSQSNTITPALSHSQTYSLLNTIRYSKEHTSSKTNYSDKNDQEPVISPTKTQTEFRETQPKSFVVPEKTVKAVNTASKITSIASLSITNVALSQRVALTNTATRCQDSNKEFQATEMGWPDSIFQVSIGGTDLKYINGALLGAWSTRAALLGGHFLVSKKFSAHKTHFPGGQILPTMFFYAGTASLETTTYRFGNSVEKSITFFSSVLQVSTIIYYALHFHPYNFEAFPVTIDKSPWLYKKVKAILPLLPKSYSITQWESLDQEYMHTMGVSFSNYKGGYQYFLIAELLTTGSLGIINGFTIPNAPTNCYPPLLATTLVQGLYTTATIAMRPFDTPLENLYFGTIASLQFTELIVATAQHDNIELQNNIYAQNFIEYTPLVIQAISMIRGLYDTCVLLYSVYRHFKPIQNALNTLDVPQDHTAVPISNEDNTVGAIQFPEDAL